MLEDMTDNELYNYLVAEYNRPFVGWDFSYLKGRREEMQGETPKPWDYFSIVVAAMQRAQSMLDMGTGGGERLAELASHYALPPQTSATEGYAPNIPIAVKRLAPLGVAVYEVKDDNHLPFVDNQFDLVINRHTNYAAQEVMRVVKPGCRFITQQIGDQTNREIHQLLGREKYQESAQKPAWNMEQAIRALQTAGWHIIEQQEYFSPVRYYDVGALVYYLKGVAWEVPDFSVGRYFPQLLEIHQRIKQAGYIDVTYHEFFIIAQKA